MHRAWLKIVAVLWGALLIAQATQPAAAQQTWQMPEGPRLVAWPQPSERIAPSTPPPVAPAGAYPWMGQTPDPFYVTPPPPSETTFDPFGWGSRYDVVQAPPNPPALPPPPPRDDSVKSRNGMFYGRAEAMIFQRKGGSANIPVIICTTKAHIVVCQSLETKKACILNIYGALNENNSLKSQGATEA